MFVVAAGCHLAPNVAIVRPDATEPSYVDTLRKWQQGAPVRVVLIGNSMSLGFYADGWQRIEMTGADDPAGAGRLTAQSHDDDDVLGVATQLRALLRSRNPESILVNESRNGWDTPMFLGLSGAPPVNVLGRVIAATPKYDMALVPLEINDLGHGLAFDTFQFGLREIVKRLKDAGIVPVLVKENDIGPLQPSRFGVPWAKYMDEVDVIAEEAGLSVVDGYTPFHEAVVAAGSVEASGLLYDNDLHPTQAGHDILFAAYKKWFLQTLPPVGRRAR